MTLSLKTLEPYLAILVAALPVLVIGATFGWGLNHSTYLVEGIKIAHPEIWQNDWWVNETTHYHFLFSYLVYGLEKLVILKPALVVANILVIFASFYLIYRIIREVYGPRALEIFVVFVLLFAVIHKTQSVAQTFFFIDSLQPSSFGALGFLLGMFYFIRGRYFSSGLSVAILSLFHANFLILAFPLFGLAHIFVREKRLVKRLFWQLGPLLLGFLFLLPSILSTVDLTAPKEVVDDALNIIFKIRSPWHYDFSYFKGEFVFLFGWLLMGVGALYFGWKKNLILGRFSALFWAMVLIILVAFMEGLWIKSDFMARLFIWRLAPFVLMFAMIIFISAVFEDRWPEKISPTANRWFFASFFMGSMAVILVETSKLINLHGNYPLVFAYLPLVLIVFWFLNFFQSSLKKRPDSPSGKLKFSRGLLTYGLASFMIPFQMTGLFDTCRFSYLADNCHSAEESLYKNVRTITGNNSIFITPPNLVRFRLFTHRAVVASWDEVPFTPQETLEWYRRMSDIVGVEQISSWQGVNSFYQTQTVDNLIKLREKYGVDYAVFRNEGSFNPAVLETFGPPVYKNKVFFLFSLKKEQQTGE